MSAFPVAARLRAAVAAAGILVELVPAPAMASIAPRADHRRIGDARR